MKNIRFGIAAATLALLLMPAATAAAATTSLPARPARVFCDALSTTNISRSGPQTVDTIALGVGKIACLTGESDNKNGAFVVGASAWKAVDPGIGTGVELYATAGSANTNAIYGADTTGPIIWGTTNVTFTLKSGAGAAFNPHIPGPIGDTTPSTLAATTIAATTTTVTTTNSQTVQAAVGSWPMVLSGSPANSFGATAIWIKPASALTAQGAAILELSNSLAQGSVGNWFIGVPSAGQSDALCDAVMLTASGAITDGQVVVFTGAKNTVAAAAASGNLLTIAGVAVGAASGGKVLVARSGYVYVNAVAGTMGATLLVTSGATAGSVATGAAAIGALVGRSLESVGGTVSGKLLCQLILG